MHPSPGEGAALALLTAIARLIPEGQTTTPFIHSTRVAALAKHTERTARTARDLLEGLRVIQVHDRGQGKAGARYEILQLGGARPPIAAPLPLRADLRAAPRRAKEERSTSDLFSEVKEPAPEIFAEVPFNIGNFFRSWVVNIGNFFRSRAPHLDLNLT